MLIGVFLTGSRCFLPNRSEMGQLSYFSWYSRNWWWGVHSERGAGAGGTAGASAIASGRADPLPLAAIVGGVASWIFFGDFMVIFTWFHGFMGFNGNLMGYNYHYLANNLISGLWSWEYLTYLWGIRYTVYTYIYIYNIYIYICILKIHTWS